MKYDNPDIPEGINLTPVNPLRELARLFSGLMLVITVTIVTLSYLAGSLAQHIPFAWEPRLLGNPINQLMASRERPEHLKIERYLQQLADGLAAEQGLAEGMSVTIHYFNGPMVNAFASLGGHIMVFRGALQNVPNENALAQLSFTRAQESAADDQAMGTLLRYYGHTGWADSFFRYVAASKQGEYPPKFLSSHPNPEARIAHAQQFRRKNPDTSQPIATPLPDFILALKTQ